ncbi:MAG: flavodoxin domain-containing protein, partial [Fibrobacteria bacterium]
MNATVSFIPESAPFSVDQRMWLNGFLAGMSNSGKLQSTIPVPPPAPKAAVPAIPLLVLFGSQSGTGEGLAQAFADKLRAHAFAGGGARVEPRVLGMNNYKDIAWADEMRVFMLTSTWGDGDMPDNAVAFWDWLKGSEAPSMAHMTYSVMGLGDRNYTRFCQAGKNLDSRFAELGAKRLLPLCECDTDYEAKTEAWMTEALGALDALVAADPALASAIAAAAEGASRPHSNGHMSHSVAVVNGTSVNGANGTVSANGAKDHVNGTPAKTPPVYSRKHPFQAVLLENHTLNARGSGKDTRHISISLLGSGLEYRVG